MKCKKDVLCEWDDPKKTCASRSKPAPDICLTGPEDKFRTCFQRSVDPSNELIEDTILRDEYNLGALMYENGQASSVSTLSYITPYTRPYKASDEKLTFGSIYLSMVVEDVKELTCTDKLELEEVTLEWLKASWPCLYQK